MHPVWTPLRFGFFGVGWGGEEVSDFNSVHKDAYHSNKVNYNISIRLPSVLQEHLLVLSTSYLCNPVLNSLLGVLIEH